MQTLPIIDIGPLSEPYSEAWQPVISAIDSACRNSGFFYIKNHGISPEQMQSMFALSASFFNLPYPEKESIAISESHNHRGWGHTGAEQLDPEAPTDWKETFDMALDLHKDHPLSQACPEFYGPNRYPQMATFQQAMNQHYELLSRLSMRILEAMALALKEPKDFFTTCFEGQTSVLRLLHYPPRTSESSAAPDQAAGAHTDYGCITLLAQDDVGGLEVQANDGQWISAPPVENTFVVNIGDLMQRWTNDQYKSTAHRVKSPPPYVHRYAIPFFVEPRFDTQVDCIKSCVPEGQIKKYEAVESGAWIKSRFDATYDYRKEGEALTAANDEVVA